MKSFWASLRGVRKQLSQGAGAVADQFLDTRTYVLGLAVCPGQGAWLFGGGDGDPRDLDKSANNRLSFALDEFDALPSGGAGQGGRYGPLVRHRSGGHGNRHLPAMSKSL